MDVHTLTNCIYRSIASYLWVGRLEVSPFWLLRHHHLAADLALYDCSFALMLGSYLFQHIPDYIPTMYTMTSLLSPYCRLCHLRQYFAVWVQTPSLVSTYHNRYELGSSSNPSSFHIISSSANYNNKISTSPYIITFSIDTYLIMSPRT